jgi:predicted acetyltransferase
MKEDFDRNTIRGGNMEPEIRPARAEEMDEFLRVVSNGLAFAPEFKLKLKPEWTLCAFTAGKLATTYGAWPLTMQFTETAIPVAGITMVSTFPIYRRRNYLRKVTEAHFRQLYERKEQPISVLMASMTAIYHRYGYAVVCNRNTYSLEPRYLLFANACSISGELSEAGDGEMNILLDLYHRFASQRIGYLRRGESVLIIPEAPFSMLNSSPPVLPLIKLIYREAGKPMGYIIYSVVRDVAPGNQMGQHINVLDLVWLSPAAYHALWGFMSAMDLPSRIEWGRVPQDDPLRHLLLEPRKLNITSGDGMMARIVDVERALPLRRYAAEGTLTFSVIDRICPWNSGSWRLVATETGNEITRTTVEPQLVMPVSTLAMLLFGQINTTQAAAMGRLEANDLKALSLWDRVMFTAHSPFCADSF